MGDKTVSYFVEGLELPKHGDEKIEKQDVGHHHVDSEESDNEAVLLRTSLVVWIILT